MGSERERQVGNSPFRPMFTGCVARDLIMARALGEVYHGELSRVAANIYRSVIVSAKDPMKARLLEHIATEDCEHFRMLGELIFALGGSPMIRTVVRTDTKRHGCTDRSDRDFAARQLIREALCEKTRTVEKLEGLLAKSEDRVVRSLLTNLLREEEGHAAALRQALS